MIFDEYSYLSPGDSFPGVEIESVEGDDIITWGSDNIILLNFFIVPCKHCKKMLEYIQEQIWPDFQESGGQFLSIGREHSKKEVKEFRDHGNYLVPFAADPDRSIYDQFAQKKVPRNYLFNQEGQLVYQTRGFDLDQLSTLGKILKDLRT
jgi:peroxiredoxin